jgi:sulfur dioxygenase
MTPKLEQGYAGDVSVQEAHAMWRSGQALLIDIRTDAERAWVGFVPEAPAIEWKSWPGMAINPRFDEQLQSLAPAGSSLVLLCRSGIRSIAAAQRAQSLGYAAYNILGGFEGDPDSAAHRGTVGGWKVAALPWAQN